MVLQIRCCRGSAGGGTSGFQAWYNKVKLPGYTIISVILYVTHTILSIAWYLRISQNDERFVRDFCQLPGRLAEVEPHAYAQEYGCQLSDWSVRVENVDSFGRGVPRVHK